MATKQYEFVNFEKTPMSSLFSNCTRKAIFFSKTFNLLFYRSANEKLNYQTIGRNAKVKMCEQREMPLYYVSCWNVTSNLT